MPHPNFILLYVANPTLSAHFYADLLGTKAIEASATFAMFALDSGVMLGLWAKHTVLPTAVVAAGSNELAFAVENNHLVDTMAQNWQERGIHLTQTPTVMDFGYTFVGLDPDGHRLRVFAPSGN